MEQTTKSTGIVARILAFLNITDEGKIGHFINKQINTLKRDIEGLKRNIETLQFNHKIKLQDIDEKIEDATSAFEEAFLNVPIDKVNTNEKQTSFAEEFWKNISEKEEILRALEKQRRELEESFTKAVEDISKQIGVRENRLEKLN